jgi:hypothetical protein
MLDFTPAFRLPAWWRRYGLDALDPAAAQETELLKLVSQAQNTQFGRDHGFSQIRSVKDFQARAPLRRYEDFWEQYWEQPFPHLADVSWPGSIPYFAVTSGTTKGVTKYIPCSAAMLQSNVRASTDILVHHLNARPGSRILSGRGFVLGGSTDLSELAPGIRAGDLSGIAAAEVPWWARPRYFPSEDLALLADWEEKIARLAPASLEAEITSISGTPSWLLIFFDALHDLRPELPHRLASYYPDLELVVHGGIGFEPYQRQFETLLEGSHAELREVYAASEGFIAIADRGPGEGMRLNLDIGLFFEFVPLDELDSDSPTRHWIADAEPGVNYALVLSSCAGVWSYVVGDTVRLVERDPPRLLVTGRTSYMLSAFGEHLIGEEIEHGVATAAEAIGEMVADFSVGAVFPKAKGELGRHLYIVEFGEVPSTERLALFEKSLDGALCETNEDYEAHRAGGFGLHAPRIHAVPHGTFAAWMKKRGKLGGQNKVPRIMNDEALFQDLRDFTKAE